jgi:pimeloyl-ACP methyl ester carboxylesterase
MLEEHYAHLNGVRLHYVTAGTGNLVLFVHGFPEFWYAWKKQLLEFGKDHLAAAPDMRGYNLSEKPPAVDQYQLKLLVEDLRALAEHLGQKPFVLVGHDWGGMVAWAFALHYPDYLRKLVVINAPHPAIFDRELRENPAQQKASEYMLMFRSSRAEEILSANNYAFLFDGVLREGLKAGHFTDEDRRAYLDAWSKPGALTGGLNYYRAAHAGPPVPGTAPGESGFAGGFPTLTVKVPTLVIWGEKDPYLLTGNLDGLEEFVPDLAVKRIPDATHWVVHEKPALVNDSIRAFLRK